MVKKDPGAIPLALVSHLHFFNTFLAAAPTRTLRFSPLLGRA